MNILFLTLGRIESICDRGIYTDLIRELCKRGNRVYAVCPSERREGKNTRLDTFESASVLHVKTGNITKCRLAEKTLSTLCIEKGYIRAIRKYFKGVSFDLVLLSTPPITFESVARFVKKRDKAKCYLMLKDIFPQNAVDLGLVRSKGITSFVYRFFKARERSLYRVCDRIGCMSLANIEYLYEKEKWIEKEKVVLCPNALEPAQVCRSADARRTIREKYALPQDKKIFVYGGNLGRPQGISFIIECLEMCRSVKDAFFLVVGDGTEYARLEKAIENRSLENVRLMKRLDRNEYEGLLCALDVGLVFLDSRFTVPNFPSRMLSYMQASMPVIASTDRVTDIGRVICENNFGYHCTGDDAQGFARLVKRACKEPLSALGENARKCFLENYTSSVCCDLILEQYEKMTEGSSLK